MEYTVKADIGGKPFSIQAGKLAGQASAAVVVQHGETILLVSAVSADEPKESSFLPLSVEYQERIYAAGRIPGNYFRREIGRPSEKETLTARLIDRPIRPLFPDKYNYETQIIATVLSMDKENEPDVLAMVGASAALEISDIPFSGPIAGIRVGRIDDSLVVNPGIEDLKKSDINMIVAGSATGVVMVEGSADVIGEAEMLEAIYFGHEALQPLIEIQQELKKVTGRAKRVFVPPAYDEILEKKIESEFAEALREKLVIPEKKARSEAMRELRTEILEKLGEEYVERRTEVREIVSNLKKKAGRNLILGEGKRIDNREFNEIRPITCEVGNLPRPHGSALFTRGETQVLGTITLGSSDDEQRIETLSGDTVRQFLLHYNFQPFSVGEARRIMGPSRRDIGHGTLARKALENVLPSSEEFDYTIRVVSEVLSSNGSSSMATVCAGSMALMDGGVPIREHVAGIAMGLIKEGEQIVILSDILGDEDHTGDMDFKVAGTKEGVTAFQMDIKIAELSKSIMETALENARDGRLAILDKMYAAIAGPRESVSEYAPAIISLKINPEKIGELIGPGGKVIRSIQAETDTKISVNDAGQVKIAAFSAEDGEAARQLVDDIVREPEVGEIYEGTVVKIMDFGAFVRIFPGTDGLVHISQLAHRRVNKVTDVVNEGDVIKVKVLDCENGKLRLSLKATLQPPERGGRY